MPKYKARPEFVDAIQFNRDNFDEVAKFTNGIARDFEIERRPNGKCTCLLADEGPFPTTPLTVVHEGDYIVRTSFGGYKMMFKKAFEDKYEHISED